MSYKAIIILYLTKYKMAFANVLNDEDISLLLQHEAVSAVLSSDAVKTRFRIPLPDTVKEKLKSGLGLDLFSVDEVPMMYIRGDMVPHVDAGVSDFKNTYLVYLTDSGGKFVVGDDEYDIQKGCGFKFERGLLHSTTGTGNEGRLMIGPLSDMGFEVGNPPGTYYFPTLADANVNTNGLGGTPDVYTVGTYGGFSSWKIAPLNSDGLSPGGDTVYNAGFELDSTFVSNPPRLPYYYLYPATGGDIPCFVAASNLLTPSGYKSAADIKSGDLLMTADGRQVPVKSYSFTVDKADKDSAPFLIPKNSISMGCPTADLRLSPWHAFQMKKGLWMKPMSAFELGMPVKQYDIGKPVTYYHFETPDYFKDNFVCDGTVVESFGVLQIKGMKGRVYTYNSNLKGYTRAAAKSVSKAKMM
jgi:hypothetical protein